MANNKRTAQKASTAAGNAISDKAANNLLAMQTAALASIRELGHANAIGAGSRLSVAEQFMNDCAAGFADASMVDRYVKEYADGSAEKGKPINKASQQTMSSQMVSFAHPMAAKHVELVKKTMAEMRATKRGSDQRKALSREQTGRDELAMRYTINNRLATLGDKDVSAIINPKWIGETVAKEVKAVVQPSAEDVAAKAKAAIAEQVGKLQLDDKMTKARDAFFKLVGIAIPAKV